MRLGALFDERRMREIRAILKKGEAGAFRKAEPATERGGVGAGFPALSGPSGPEAVAVASMDLFKAVRDNDLGKARDALSRGANPDSRDDSGITRFVSIGSGPLPLSDPGAATQGDTMLMIAVENGNLSMVRLLIKAGADVNASKNYGSCPFPTPLRIAIDRGQDTIASVLRQCGAKE